MRTEKGCLCLLLFYLRTSDADSDALARRVVFETRLTSLTFIRFIKVDCSYKKSLSLKLIKKRFNRNNKRLLSKAVHYNTHKHDIMLFRIAWHKEEEAMSDSFGYWLPSSSNTFSRPKADSSITIAILTSIYVIYSELNANLNNVTHAQSSRTKWVIR